MYWRYTWQEVQDYLNQLPYERVITISSGMKGEDANVKYLQSTCDKSVTPTTDKQMVDFILNLDSYKKVQDGN